MTAKFYINNGCLTAGITMKEPSEPESGNMALHACINAENILANRRKFAELAGCDPEAFVCGNQCHSANFHKVTKEDRGRGSVSAGDAIPNTDALYTFEPDLLLCCFTADCVPVIFYSQENGLIGVIHSGWSGTVQEITPKVLRHVIEKENCCPSHLQIFIGPAISMENFEVDRDVSDRFRDLGYADELIRFKEATGKYHIDNQMTVKKQCELQGIPPENITVDRTCTFDSPLGFSYRQDKNCGRHMSFIIRKQ